MAKGKTNISITELRIGNLMYGGSFHRKEIVAVKFITQNAFANGSKGYIAESKKRGIRHIFTEWNFCNNFYYSSVESARNTINILIKLDKEEIENENNKRNKG
jgi:hypothetical protein